MELSDPKDHHPVEIYSIHTGSFRLDGGAMFGVVPKEIWKKRITTDRKNRIQLALRILLVKDGDCNILIDTGFGNWHSEKFKRIYGLENPGVNFHDVLAPYDLTPDDITDLVVTHLHFDHIAGIVRQEHDQLVPTFPRARIWVQKKQWLWACNPCPKDRASYLPEYMDFLKVCPQVKRLDGPSGISRHIRCLTADGHSPGLQIPVIETPSQTCVFATDLLPTQFHLPDPYVTSYEIDPLLHIREKRDFLDQAVQNNWRIYFQHDPQLASAHLCKIDKKFSIDK